MKYLIFIIALSYSTTLLGQNFKITPETKQGLEQIKTKIEAKESLDIFLGIGVFYSIFGDGPSLTTAYSISTTDWRYLGEAIIGSRKITRSSILKVCDFQIYSHSTMRSNNSFDKSTIRKNLKFWKQLRSKFEE